MREVYKIVWNRGLFDALNQLFTVSEDLVPGKDLHDQLLQALPIEKQELVRQMELITFYTDDADQIISDYSQIIGTTSNDFKELERLIETSFSQIKDVSGIDCYNYPRCWTAFTRFYPQILLTESENHPIGPKGTFISHYASALKGSFQYDANWLITKDVLDTSDEAIFFQDFLKSIMIGMTNEGISLLDVPSIASISNPFVSPQFVSF